jgi:hypothetical protein
MTKDEALKLALEALEYAAEKVYCQNNDDNIALAIAAIKEALAQPEDYIASIIACRDALDAQPVPAFLREKNT